MPLIWRAVVHDTRFGQLDLFRCVIAHSLASRRRTGRQDAPGQALAAPTYPPKAAHSRSTAPRTSWPSLLSLSTPRRRAAVAV
jgi:hypothetical protein